MTFQSSVFITTWSDGQLGTIWGGKSGFCSKALLDEFLEALLQEPRKDLRTGVPEFLSNTEFIILTSLMRLT